MQIKHVKFLLTVLCLAPLALAQVQDTSGNGMLHGNFRFRHLTVKNIDPNFNPSEIAASYGSITFDGAGNYTITGTTVDNLVSSGAPKSLSVTGKYAIGSNGLGYLANPLSPTDANNYIYGAVAQGVYTGSSTESINGPTLLLDLFVAIPVGAAPTNTSFTTPYQTGVLDFAGANSSAIKNALFKLTPDGKGNFASISATGQASNQNADSLTQTTTGGTYNFAGDGSATLTIPLPSGVSAANALFTGSKTLFQSSDGNFILGWTATGYDIFFGVKALTTNATNSTSQGLYFTAALEDTPATGFGMDSYYGATNNLGNSNGDGIVHQRVNSPAWPLPVVGSLDYGTDDLIQLKPDGSTQTDLNGYNYIFGDGGQAFVAIGTGGIFALQLGLHAPNFSGPGVYLNPIGVVNAASYAPVTASLAPGELITLYGTGLSSGNASMQGGQTFPTKLNGVSVSINNLPCPIYYVTPTQISAIVPYEVASNKTGLANIQVTNNGVVSNIVQMYLTDAEPGAFSVNQNGIGYAAALHASSGALITESNPAQAGEYISLFLTGLGPVTPGIADGGLGPTKPLSTVDLNGAGNLAIFFNDYDAQSIGNMGTIQFAGLAPGLAGLYQVNVQVPSSGLSDGDLIYVEFETDAADVNQIQIPYGSSSQARRTAAPRARALRAHPHFGMGAAGRSR